MSEESVQEQVQMQVPVQKKQNKMHMYFKNRDFFKLICHLFLLPLFIGAIFGLIITVFINIFNWNFGSLNQESSFWEKFSSVFCIFFPLSVIVGLVQKIRENFYRKYKQFVILLILAPGLLFMVWHFGGRQAFELYKSWINERIETAIGYGDTHAGFQKTEDAVSQYKKAVFLDKYLALWNDNKNLPVLYYKIAKSYGDAEDFDNAVEYIEKSLEAFNKYSPEDLNDISLVHLFGCVVFGAMNDYDSVKFHAFAANEYYKDNYNTVDRRSLAQSYVWLAHAYFNEGDYTNSVDCLENGIPLFYESTSWGYGDTYDAKVIAILYKMASYTYSNIGNQEKSKEYNDKYEDFMWYRDFSESDLDYYINYFHWMNR